MVPPKSTHAPVGRLCGRWTALRMRPCWMYPMPCSKLDSHAGRAVCLTGAPQRRHHPLTPRCPPSAWLHPASLACMSHPTRCRPGSDVPNWGTVPKDDCSAGPTDSFDKMEASKIEAMTIGSHGGLVLARAQVADFVTELGWPRPTPQPCSRCSTRDARVGAG